MLEPAELGSPRSEVRSREPAVRSEDSPAARGARLDLAVEFCPRCSTRLEPQRCKVVCSRCGYFMSCSEFE